jgi:hypothetical protein
MPSSCVSQLERGNSLRIATLTVSLPDYAGLRWADLAIDPRHAAGHTIFDAFGEGAVDSPLLITRDASRVADAFAVLDAAQQEPLNAEASTCCAPSPTATCACGVPASSAAIPSGSTSTCGGC